MPIANSPKTQLRKPQIPVPEDRRRSDSAAHVNEVCHMNAAAALGRPTNSEDAPGKPLDADRISNLEQQITNLVHLVSAADIRSSHSDDEIEKRNRTMMRKLKRFRRTKRSRSSLREPAFSRRVQRDDDTETSPTESEDSLGAPVRSPNIRHVVTPVSPRVKWVRPASPQPSERQPEDSALRLIEALEREEAVVREKESMYITKVKDLDADLEATRARLAKAEEELTNLRKKFEIATAERMEKEKEAAAAVARLESRNEQLANALDESKKLLSTLTAEKERCRHDKEDLNSTKEISIYKKMIKQLQKDLKALGTSMNERETWFQSKITEIKENRQLEEWEVTNKTVKQIIRKYEIEVGALIQEADAVRAEKAALENGYVNALQEERQRYELLLASLNSEKDRCAELAKENGVLSSKERMFVVTIKDLSKVVEDQKMRINDLVRHSEASYSIFQEKAADLEQRLKDLDRMNSEKNDCEKRISALSHDLALKDRNAGRETGNLRAKVDVLEAESKKFHDLHEMHSHTLRIKEKMLDDQLLTIKTLKQNLENKTREHANLLQENAHKKEAGFDELHKCRSLIRELEGELEDNEITIADLQESLSKSERRREALAQEVADIAEKLRARNDSIALIESEVERMTVTFKEKEEKLLNRVAQSLYEKDKAQEELKKLRDSSQSMEMERQAFLSSIHQLTTELRSVDALKDNHEQEMQSLLGELEKQRAKFARLREAISE
ncbi:hypothetical protein HK101_010451 [Irineochytrium annulatum]|nr:hypothetical protein HK101_010451 [Irineochytrium annulatum]